MKITLQDSILIALTVIIIGAFLGFITGIIGAGDLYVGTATVILAAVTFTLVWGEIDSSKKERRRERLKEQLEGMYSPLMGLGDDFEDAKFHMSYSEHIVRETMMKIRSVYSYLASNALKSRLDLYYKQYHARDFMPNRLELDNLRVLFTADYEEITKEYRELTISEAEEKRRAEIAKAASEAPLPK
jgi:hypothetical protein